MQFWILQTNYSISVFSFVTTYVAILLKFHSFFVISFTCPYLCLKEKCFFHLNQARLSSSLLCLISLIKILQYRILCGSIFHAHKVFKTIPLYCVQMNKLIQKLYLIKIVYWKTGINMIEKEYLNMYIKHNIQSTLNFSQNFISFISKSIA